jgi:biotin carboxylase
LSSPASSGKPRLAVPFGRATLSPLALAQAAAGICDLLWLVDLSDPDTAAIERMMRRFGTIVDLAGIPPESWADAVAAREPAGILTFFDTNMVAFAEMARQLGLPFHSPEVAGRLLDKARQRQAFRDAGLPTPRSWVIPVACPPSDYEDLLEEVSYPAIFKPQFGNDSKLTYPAPDAPSLRQLIEARNASNDAVPMVVEEYLADTKPRLGDGLANYLSVETFVRGGNPHHFAITGRFPPAEPFRETGFFIPSTVSGSDRDAVLEVASAAIRAIGIETGCLHTEIKFTPDGPRIIEVNGRLGGGIPLMFELATGALAVRLAMQVALGIDPGELPEPTPDTIGFRFLFHAPMWATEVTALEGLDGAGTLPGVTAVTLHRGPGSVLDWRIGNHGYVFAASGAVASYSELRDLYRSIEETVVVSYSGRAD